MKKTRMAHYGLRVIVLWLGLWMSAMAQDSGCLIEPSAELKLGVPADGVLDRVMDSSTYKC
jgi:hypothetical protein